MEISTRSAPLDTGVHIFLNCVGGNVVYVDIHGYKFKGSRPRCLCRFVCCTLLITVFLIVSIFLTLALVRLFAVPGKFPLIPTPVYTTPRYRHWR